METHQLQKGAIPLVKKTYVILAGLLVVWLFMACEKPKEPVTVPSETTQLSTLQVEDEIDLTVSPEQIVPDTPERWEWVATYTGFFGQIAQPEFNSYINIYRTGQDPPYYEVFVNDELYSKGELNPAQLPTSIDEVITTIEFPHDTYASISIPRRIQSMNTKFQYCQDTFAFSVEAADCFYYFYAKTIKN
jgi:hypothetical protein